MASPAVRVNVVALSTPTRAANVTEPVPGLPSAPIAETVKVVESPLARIEGEAESESALESTPQLAAARQTAESIIRVMGARILSG